MSSNNWLFLDRFDTEYSADSVEWCPHEPHKNVFVCGTYQLTETEQNEGILPQKRIGRLLLFIIDSESIKCVQKIETAAILDQKWCHCKINGQSLLGVANAIGELQIYALDSVDQLQLTLVATTKIENSAENILALSLDWSTGKYDSETPEIVISDSSGNVSIFKLNTKELICEYSIKKAHDYEAWICSFNYWNPSIIYTGGDDCKLKTFDRRINNAPISVNRNHSAGVTSLNSNSRYENVLASGSYDEMLLIWDTRNMKNPSSSTKMSGGVWRIKWDPFEQNDLLAACMYGSFHIIDARNFSEPSIKADYKEHKSIAYGADWSFMNKNSDRYIVTCSFYDHLLTLSKYVVQENQ